MTAAMRLGKVKWLGCAAHTLQLVIQDGVLKSRNIRELSHKCRKIVANFKRSEQACRYRKTFQDTVGLPNHTLIQDADCRWNITYLMLNRLYEQKAAINLYIAERGSVECLTAKEWKSVCYVVAVLKPFDQATLDLPYDSTCASVIIPLIAMLQIKLERNDDDGAEISMLKDGLTASLLRRFAFIKTNPELHVSTILDPRFKNKYYSTEEIKRCETILKDQLGLFNDDTAVQIQTVPPINDSRNAPN
ncbi:PREDICTED: zinc finger BED domain-containing protein 4-like [Rhagoletis zephyria]|uniref:zinc finger BED domain-containing protein 4-like n=1 Tax=Rhagoletis zephyria TaxID=28612 RepID=UPI000811857E|nr:PREDICTED: zinc finger BED domain-containing protein 4-like [Rhagoletis zephyria]